MIRVLVVDDSSFMRKAISMMLERASDITVVDTAIHGADGVEKVCELEPDVVTMDVEMPEMDGITAVKEIMKRAPRPILMVSSMTEKGAEITVEALRAGAADFIPKRHSNTSLQIHEIQEELVEKVRALSRSTARVFKKGAPSESKSPTESERSSRRPVRTNQSLELIVVGASTGGPLALQHVLPSLPAELSVPVAVVQHMPPHFTRSLADRLDSNSALTVIEATDGTPVESGKVVVARGGHHLIFERQGERLVARTPTEPDNTAHRPSLDVTFRSAGALLGKGVLGLVMTGMGDDGLHGARQIKKRGGTVYVQDEDTSVVYGMPRVVEEAGLADGIFPLDQLSQAVARTAGTPALS